MELQDLRCFMAVAQQLNFTRAAEWLHVTQPTLSRRIRDLETELGAQLFERGHHDVALTAKGELLRGEAYEILQRADAIPSLLAESPAEGASTLSGVLRIGHQAGLDYSLASRAVDVMAAEHPNVHSFASRHDLGQLREALRAGVVDVAFMLISRFDQHRGMEAYKIGESRVVVIAPAGHPLACASSIRLDDLAGQDVVMLDREVSPQTVDFVSGRCLERGFSLHACEYVRSAEDVFMRVAAGKGVAFAHSMARILDDAGALGIRVLEIEDEDMTLAYAVARREGDGSPAVAAYVDIARRLAKE